MMSLSAHAAPGYCLPAPSQASFGISVTNMTFRGNNADNCFGVVENANDSAALLNGNTLVAGGVFGGGWTEVAKDDTPGGESSVLFGGLKWFVDASPEGGAQSGTWTLTVQEDPSSPDLPLVFDLLGVLKGSNDFATYLFSAELFTAANTTGSGTWEVVFATAGNGNIPNLSHLTVYARSGGTPPETLPEPGSLALLSIAALGAGFVIRRRRNVA